VRRPDLVRIVTRAAVVVREQLDHDASRRSRPDTRSESERWMRARDLSAAHVRCVDMAERIARDLVPLHHLRHVHAIRTQPVQARIRIRARTLAAQAL